MSSVMMSARSFTTSPQIAADLADRLDYALLDESIYRIAAERYSAPEQALRRAFEQPPSLLGMSDAKRRRLAIAVTAAIASRLTSDRVVYSGPLAHLIVRGVAHLVTVRITAGLEARAKVAVAQGTPEGRAQRVVRGADRSSHQIAMAIFGAEDGDDGFDLVLDADRLGAAECVEQAAAAALADKHRTTSFSERCMAESATAQHIAATLSWDFDAEFHVTVFEGIVKVRTETPPRQKARILARAEALVGELDGVSRVELQIVEHDLRPSSTGLRG